VCGDAKFYMQILGRENAAPHWCIWCDINVQQFDFENYPTVSFWTLESMKKHHEKEILGAAQLGVYSEPLFDFCELINFLLNILHEKINTGNDLVSHLHHSIDEKIEMVTWEQSNA
jgi:hypothetical protein